MAMRAMLPHGRTTVKSERLPLNFHGVSRPASRPPGLPPGAGRRPARFYRAGAPSTDSISASSMATCSTSSAASSR